MFNMGDEHYSYPAKCCSCEIYKKKKLKYLINSLGSLLTLIQTEQSPKKLAEHVEMGVGLKKHLGKVIPQVTN